MVDFSEFFKAWLGRFPITLKARLQRQNLSCDCWSHVAQISPFTARFCRTSHPCRMFLSHRVNALLMQLVASTGGLLVALMGQRGINQDLQGIRGCFICRLNCRFADQNYTKSKETKKGKITNELCAVKYTMQQNLEKFLIIVKNFLFPFVQLHLEYRNILLKNTKGKFVCP